MTKKTIQNIEKKKAAGRRRNAAVLTGVMAGNSIAPAASAAVVTTAGLALAACETGLTPPKEADTILDWVAENFGINISVKSSAPMKQEDKDAILSRVTAAVADPSFAEYKGYMAEKNYTLRINIDNGTSRPVVGAATEGAMNITLEQAKAVDAAFLIQFLNNQGIVKITNMDYQFGAEYGGMRVFSRAPMTEPDKNATAGRIRDAFNDPVFAWHKDYLIANSYALAVYIENGGTNAGEQGCHLTNNKWSESTNAIADYMRDYLRSIGIREPEVVQDTVMDQTFAQYGNARIISRAPLTAAAKTAIGSAFGAAYDGIDNWYKSQSLALKLYIENGTAGTEADGMHKTLTDGALVINAAEIVAFYNGNGLTKPAEVVDTIMNETLTGHGNSVIVSRSPMTDADKNAVRSAFGTAWTGLDEWYKGRPLIVKLFVENGGTNAGEQGIHLNLDGAKAISSAQIVQFFDNNGQAKPLETILQETIASGRISVKSSAAMNDADKAAVKSGIENALNGATWHRDRMAAKSIVLTISVNNGGTALSAGLVLTEAQAKALTAATIEQWLDANNAQFQPESLTVSIAGMTTTAKSRVPLESADKTAAQQKINSTGQQTSFAWYPVHSQSITIWIENGKTAGTESGALHITYADLVAATNAGFAETMADVIDGKANLNKSVPAEYTGTKATIKTNLWLTAAEWNAIKSNIEGAVNAQNWWKDNVGASQLKVDVGGTTGGYAQLSQTQANAGTATIWPILKAFLETQTAFQSGNYSTDGWTVYFRVPMSGTQKGYVDQAIAYLGWYKTNAQAYNKVYVNNGPDNLSDGGNGTVITGSPASMSAVQNAILSFLNGKNIIEPTGPTYLEFTLPGTKPNITIKYDDRISFNTSEKIKIRDAYDSTENNNPGGFNGKTVKLFVEVDGTPTSVNVGGVHVAYGWIQMNNATDLSLLFRQWIAMAETARAMPQQQNNFKVILGNEVLASVRDGKFFNGNAWAAEEKFAAEKKLISQKRALDVAVNPIDRSRAGWKKNIIAYNRMQKVHGA
jgi:hypothetical protein